MTPHSEHTEVRLRALACALQQLMLLAIHPVAALAARAARVHAKHRHGARLVPSRGFAAELVSAAIEREVIETGSERHRAV